MPLFDPQARSPRAFPAYRRSETVSSISRSAPGCAHCPRPRFDPSSDQYQLAPVRDGQAWSATRRGLT